uniref:Uncharacterized protein n=1 Tax=Caenorhabditis tropicalis TaxID=1561998 RepID=A0A1I7V1X8_9PELO
MEKSAEFWKSKDNTKKLADYLKRYDRKRNPSRSRSRSRDRKRSGNSNRRRSPSRNRPTASPGNKESLKMLFASADNSSQLPANFDQFQAPPPNFIPTLPSILSMPLQPSTMNFQPPPVNYPPNGHLPMMNEYGQYPQQMMPMPQPTQFPPIRPQGYTMSREDEAALMDEIFS